jgi:hypothetical protein
MVPTQDDDYVITRKDTLYRRFPISDEPKYEAFWKFENGRKVPSSAAFKTKPEEDGLSVDIAALTSPEQTQGNSLKFGVAEISASTPIYLGYQCIQNKMLNNRAHALILGDTNPIAKKLSKAIINVY